MNKASNLLAAAQELRPQMAFFKAEYERLKALIEGLEAEHSRTMKGGVRPRAVDRMAEPSSGSLAGKFPIHSGFKAKASGPNGNIKVAARIDEAAQSQTKPYSIVDICGYLDQRYPGHGIKNARISNELWVLRKKGTISYHTKSEKGGHHTYTNN